MYFCSNRCRCNRSRGMTAMLSVDCHRFDGARRCNDSVDFANESVILPANPDGSMNSFVSARARWFLSLCFLAAPLLVGDAACAAEPVTITEFVASNSNGLQDEDGSHPDWIEIFNGGATNVNLDGWFLTDSPDNLT